MKSDFNTIYMYFQNNWKFHQDKLPIDMRVKSLVLLYKETHIKKHASFFAEAYLPLMYRSIITFMKNEERMSGRPYQLPAKKVMMEYARFLCEDL